MGDIFGRNPVLEALKSNRTINKIWLAKGDQKGSVREIVALAKEKRITVQLVERNKLDSMFPHENHQGVAASIASADYVDWRDIVDAARKKGEDPLLVILDELEDPHNLGAILRSVDAVGAHGVIIPKRRAVPLTDGVAKASAGAIEHVPVARVGNIVQVINDLKKEGIWIAGASMHGTYMHKQDLTGPLATTRSVREAMGSMWVAFSPFHPLRAPTPQLLPTISTSSPKPCAFCSFEV